MKKTRKCNELLKKTPARLNALAALAASAVARARLLTEPRADRVLRGLEAPVGRPATEKALRFFAQQTGDIKIIYFKED